MFYTKSISAFIPTSNLTDSMAFYKGIIGLELIAEDNFGCDLQYNNSYLRITLVGPFTPQPFTIFGIKVTKISNYISELISKGIVMEKYESLEQDELGIWTSPNNAKVAWCKDPDGNIISFTE